MLRCGTAHPCVCDEQLAYIASEIARRKRAESPRTGARRALVSEESNVIAAHAGRDVRVELVGSSNGCASFMVYVGDRTLKCYECLTPRRARLVQYLSSELRTGGVEVPECFGVQGRIVVTEWVEGQSMSEVAESQKIDLMATYQAKIHSLMVAPTLWRHGSMPHIRWLFHRVRQFGHGYVDDGFLWRLREQVIRSRPKDAPGGVLHSDLITTNLVITRRGVVSIDNEFLCLGYGQEWDVLNTLKVSFPNQQRLQDRYLDTYAKYRSLYTLFSHRDYWEASYDIKIAGKRLSEGKIEEGLHHLRAASAKV